MINKMIEAIPGESWVCLTETPNGWIRIEGLKENFEGYQASSIVFTKDAIKAMLPFLIDWVKEKEQ